MPVIFCKVDETAQAIPEPVESIGVRSWLLGAYQYGSVMYAVEGYSKIVRGSAVQRLRDAGCMFWYGHKQPHTGRKKRLPVKVDEMVKKWHLMVVGLATAHDKDGIDRYEAGVEECLLPMLAAPVKQLREFAPKLLASLK